MASPDARGQARVMTDCPAPILRDAASRLITPPELRPRPAPRADFAPAKEEVPVIARRLAHQVGSALVEVLQGRRTPANLAAVMDDDVYATVEHLARGGLRSELRLRGVHAQMPSPGVVEASLALRDEASGRTRAAALRLENRGARWLCQALEIALTDDGVTRARGSS